jgi:hypothetical protein
VIMNRARAHFWPKGAYRPSLLCLALADQGGTHFAGPITVTTDIGMLRKRGHNAEGFFGPRRISRL